MNTFIKRVVLRMAAGAICVLAFAQGAVAQTPLRVGYIKTYAMLPLFQAEKQGYFKSRGLDVDLVVLNNGPAVASAIASGNLDVGYAAVEPILSARARGQNFRFFAGTSYESAPDNYLTYYVASTRSGVKSFKDIAGKTVAVNSASGGCEYGAHDHAAAAGADWNKVKLLTIPFPQMQAALQLGTADVVCTVDPFYSSIMNSKAIGAVVVGRGPVANMSAYKRILVDGFFGEQAWLAANAKTVDAFVAALEQGASDLQRDPTLGRRLLESELKIPPQIADSVRLVYVTDLAVHPEDLSATIGTSARYGDLPKAIKPQDMVFAAQTH